MRGKYILPNEANVTFTATAGELLEIASRYEEVQEALECRIPEVFKVEEKWPEGYQNYGAFGWGRDSTFVRVELIGLMDNANWGHTHEGPAEYVCYPGNTFEAFTECLPSWVRKHDFNKG